MTPLTGKHLKHMAANAKEPAAGIDQLSPGDFRLLSDLAFEHLAELMNSIEATCRWPKELTHTGANFLTKEEEEGEHDDVDDALERWQLVGDAVSYSEQVEEERDGDWLHSSGRRISALEASQLALDTVVDLSIGVGLGAFGPHAGEFMANST